MTDQSQLSMFEMVEVVANVLGVGGTIKDPALEPLTEFLLGDRVVLLVVGHVKTMAFSDGDVGRIRTQKVEADEAYQIDHLVDLPAILKQVRVEQTEALEARMGIKVGAELRQMIDEETDEIGGEG